MRLMIILGLVTVFLLGSPAPSRAEDAADAIHRANVAVVSLYQQGRHAEALAQARSVLDQAEQALGPEHPETLSSVNNLAFLYRSQGQYEEAEPLQRRALEVRERVLGPEHPKTLTSVTNLAGLYQSQGRYEEAEPLFRRVLAVRERVLGPDHPKTLTSVNNLAGILDSLGRTNEAEPLFRRALEARERVLGPDHPDTLNSASNLGLLYRSQGRYGEAEPLLRRAMDTFERVLVSDHPSTLQSVNNLGLLYLVQGRYGEAEPLLRRALEGFERVLGPEHPLTLTSATNLAELYGGQGRYGEAEPLHRRALEIRERVLGPDHPKTLASVNNLAGLYESQGQYEKAESLYDHALKRFERILGQEHPSTLVSVNNLAGLYESQGRYGEAEPLYRRVLEARERVLGLEHPDTLTSVSNLAVLFEAQGRYKEAERHMRRALEGLEHVLGPEHPKTLKSVNNLAALYQAQGLYEEAEPRYRRALEGRERVLGPEHPDTLTSVNNLGYCYEAQGRYEEAEPLYHRALETSERVLGPEHRDTLASVNNLASLHAGQGRHREAEKLYRRALEGQERVLEPAHPDTITARGNLAILLVRMERVGDALRLFRDNDQALAWWTGTEVRTAQAARTRRLVLQRMRGYQDAGLSLAFLDPSAETAAFAADLTLRWKKRLAHDDAVLNNLARESGDPTLLGAIDRVRTGQRALSNAAFDPHVSEEEKTRLREKLEAAEADLRARSDRFLSYSRMRATQSEEVQSILPAGGAVMEYKFFRPFDVEAGTYGEARLLAVVIRPQGPPQPVDLGEAGPIIAVQRLMVDPKARAGAGKSFDALARAAHDRLIAPLRPYLGDVETLFLAPDGPLHALPFGALIDRDGRYLMDTIDVRLLQTGRDLVARDRPATGTGLVALGGVAFGPAPPGVRATVQTGGALQIASRPVPETIPDTDAEAISAALTATREQIIRFPPLPSGGDEVAAIAELYAIFRHDEPAPVVLTGAEATEAAVKALAAPPRVLHLATHGYYLKAGSIEGRPLLQSGIALAGANRALMGETGPDGENGVLHAVEMQTLNLYGTELVVLSACDTGKGVYDYSEGLEGLPRALYVAGAKNVLVALWPIDDHLTVTFMSRFYETWLSNPGMTPGEALRTTKRDYYINSLDPAERDPATWAAFVLYEG